MPKERILNKLFFLRICLWSHHNCEQKQAVKLLISCFCTFALTLVCMLRANSLESSLFDFLKKKERNDKDAQEMLLLPPSPTETED